MSTELREAAQRVTGYVRARALMSNTDPEVISDIAVMPAEVGKPMEFRLLVGDLEALVEYAIGATPTEVVTSAGNDENKYGGCPVLNCGYKIEDHELPERPAATFGDDANAIINMVADTAETLAVAAMIAHHIVDHTTAELMDTIAHLGSQLRLQAVALPEEANAEIVGRTELESLRADARLLSALYAAGVDNWEGYAEVKVNR